MRFWLTLVFSTVLISFGMTWLVMHQGQQILPAAAASTESAKEEPPYFTVELGQGQQIESNVIEAACPPSELGKKYEAQVKFKNTGKGPLQLKWFKESCGCLELKVDGVVLKSGSPAVVKKPGESGVIAMAWRPEQRHLAAQDDKPLSRFSVELTSNDPRFYAPLRLEVATKIIKPAGSSK